MPKALESAEVVLDDLVLEWFRIEPKFSSVGKTIRMIQARTTTGASIVSAGCSCRYYVRAVVTFWKARRAAAVSKYSEKLVIIPFRIVCRWIHSVE